MAPPVFTSSLGTASGTAPFDQVVYTVPSGYRTVLRTIIYQQSAGTNALYIVIKPLVGAEVTAFTSFTEHDDTVSVDTRAVLYVGEQLRVIASGTGTFSVLMSGFELIATSAAELRSPPIRYSSS